jgi:hypothetical protein
MLRLSSPARSGPGLAAREPDSAPTAQREASGLWKGAACAAGGGIVGRIPARRRQLGRTAALQSGRQQKFLRLLARGQPL